MAKRTTHVIADPNGGWSVKRGGAARASKRFDNQRDAITYARNLCRHEGAEFVLHRRDGTVRNWESYGGDPMPPRDTHN